MNLEIRKSFEKDTDKIYSDTILSSLSEIISTIENAQNLREIKNLKKMEGYKNHYRIRLGDYRIGLFIDNKTVNLVRFLHRKEIYRYFP